VRLAGAGVDHGKLRSGVYGDRIVGRRHHVLFHEDFGQCGVHGVQFDVGDVIFGHLEASDAAGRDRYFDRTNLVAIPAWSLGGVPAFTGASTGRPAPGASNGRTAAAAAPAVPANRLRRVTLFIGVSPLTGMFLPD